MVRKISRKILKNQIQEIVDAPESWMRTSFVNASFD